MGDLGFNPLGISLQVSSCRLAYGCSDLAWSLPYEPRVGDGVGISLLFLPRSHFCPAMSLLMMLLWDNHKHIRTWAGCCCCPVQLLLLARIWSHPLGPHSTALGSLEGISCLWRKAAPGLCDGRAMLTLLEAGGCLISYLSHPVWDIIRASPQWQLALKHVERVRGL